MQKLCLLLAVASMVGPAMAIEKPKVEFDRLDADLLKCVRVLKPAVKL